MGAGLQQPWSTDQTEDWRRTARTVRDRLVDQAVEAVGDGREAARWNVRDRRHIDVLGRYEEVMPRLERTAIGVSVISRGLDDHARLAGTTHRAMPAMGALLVALASAVRALVARRARCDRRDADLARALAEVRARRDRCVQGASRRARLALEHGERPGGDQLEGEWLGYAALLVQVDRIVGDLSGSLPSWRHLGRDRQDAELLEHGELVPVLAQRTDPLAVELGDRDTVQRDPDAGRLDASCRRRA